MKTHQEGQKTDEAGVPGATGRKCTWYDPYQLTRERHEAIIGELQQVRESA